MTNKKGHLYVTTHFRNFQNKKINTKVTQELETQYEHRLAVELDRFDRLSEEVEAVQQRCEGLLETQQQEHQWELRAREQVHCFFYNIYFGPG